MRNVKPYKWEIEINAPVEKVWHTMLDDKTYREWTIEFNPKGSWYQGSLEEGSTIRFLGNSDTPNEGFGGILSKVKENKKYEKFFLEHQGYVMNGKDDTESESIKSWAPAYENYTFRKLSDNKTLLTIDIELENQYAEMMAAMWPKALAKLKAMSEVQTKDCDFKCESCFMPLGKNLEDAGTEADGSKSTKYCKYCYQNGKLMYEGDLETFQKICYENMVKMGMWKPKAWFFSWMIKFAPRWKK